MKKLIFGFMATLLLLGVKGYSQEKQSPNGTWLENFIRVDKTLETGNQTFFKVVQDPEFTFQIITPLSLNFVSKEVAGITTFECSAVKNNLFDITADTTIKAVAVNQNGTSPFHYEIQVAYN